ncbi:hypothetical protein HGA64_03000 [Candidatus Falkowbacteria bacterium]|nr:hypothetical protein [Candidatus Falkowbacteria bacterium]
MKTVVAKLNGLNDIVPSTEWKERTREILRMQINAGAQAEKVGVFEVIDNLMPSWLSGLSSKPVAVFTLIVLAVVTGSYASLRASRQTKPGDSLYVAKMVGEKTQMALTFNEVDKAKLNLEFASNRVEEMSRVSAEPVQQKDQAIADLNSSFTNQIDQAKSRLTKLAQSQPAAAPVKPAASKPSPKTLAVGDDKVTVTGANLGKDNVSMQIAEAQQLIEKNDIQGALTKIEAATKSADVPADTKATSTVKTEEKATSTSK